MNEYSYKVTPKGNVTWYKDGTRVGKKEIPLKFRKTVMMASSAMPKTIPVDEKGNPTCIFCGQFATKIRAVNVQGRMEEIKLCDDHYYEKSLGAIVKQLRKGK